MTKAEKAQVRRIVRKLVDTIDGVVSWYEYFDRNTVKEICKLAGWDYRDWIGED